MPHDNDHTLYMFIYKLLYLLNAIHWILVKVPGAQTQRPAHGLPDVEDSCNILSNLFSLASLQTDLS
jgi:hypothetical protein